MKTSWKTKNCYAEDVLKTSSRHVFKTSSRHVFKTSSRHVFKMSSRHVFKTSSRHALKTCLQDVLRDVFKTSLQDVFKMSSRRLGRRKIVTLKMCLRRLQDMSSRRLQVVLKTNKCLLGQFLRYRAKHTEIDNFKSFSALLLP